MTPYSIATCAGLLLCFLFVPPGSLPPLVSGAYSAYGALVPLFFCSILMNGGKSDEESLISSGIAFSFALLLAFHALAILLLKRGVPGEPFSFEMLSSIMPPEVMGAWGKAGFALLFLSLAGVLPLSVDSLKGWGVAVQLRRMCALVLVVKLFLPFSIGRFLPLQTLPLVLIDFNFFWVEAVFLALFADWYQKKASPRLPWGGRLHWHSLCLLLGVLLIASELTYKVP